MRKAADTAPTPEAGFRPPQTLLCSPLTLVAKFRPNAKPETVTAYLKRQTK